MVRPTGQPRHERIGLSQNVKDQERQGEDMTKPNDTNEPSLASAGSVGSDLYGGGFNKWLASIGKTREEATDADDIQWLKLDRHRLNNLWRWIPVTERLPEEGVDVLVVLPEQAGIKFGVYVARLSILKSLRGTFSTYFGFGYEATHWMPIPVPPTDAK